MIQNKRPGRKITLKIASSQVAEELGIYAAVQAWKVHSGHPHVLGWALEDWVPQTEPWFPRAGLDSFPRGHLPPTSQRPEASMSSSWAGMPWPEEP